MRISTTRFACTCFAPPLSITNNSDSDYNLIQPPLWHCASGRFFDASAKQGPPRILPFRASDFRSTSSAPVLITSRNSWTARNKSKRTYWGGCGFIRLLHQKSSFFDSQIAITILSTDRSRRPIRQCSNRLWAENS